jgi:hypothetical protein
MINDYLPFTRLDSTLFYLSNLNERIHPRHQTICWTVRSQLRRSRYSPPVHVIIFHLSYTDSNLHIQTRINKIPSPTLLFQATTYLRSLKAKEFWDSEILSRWNSWRCVALRRGKRVNQIQHRPSILRPWISSAPVFDFSLSLSDRFPSDSALVVSFRFSFFFFVRI